MFEQYYILYLHIINSYNINIHKDMLRDSSHLLKNKDANNGIIKDNIKNNLGSIIFLHLSLSL